MTRLSLRTLAGALMVSLLLAASSCGLVGRGTMTLTAVFPDSAGLFIGNDVGVLGVPVGTVTAIEPEGDHVNVTLEITDDDVSIPATAGAAVVARSVATDRYVELTPVYRSGPLLGDGDVIPLQRTVTPVDFDKVLESVRDFGQGLVRNPRTTNSLREVIDLTARTLDGKGEQLNRTLVSLSDAVTSVEGQSDDIFATMDSLDTLTRALARDEGTVRAFLENVADASELLATERTNLGRALTRMSRAVDDVARFASKNRGAIRRDVVDLTAVVRSVLASRRDLAETIEVLPLATHNLALTEGPTGNIRVRANLVEALPAGAGVVEDLCEALGTACDGLSVPPSLDELLGAIGGGRP